VAAKLKNPLKPLQKTCGLYSIAVSLANENLTKSCARVPLDTVLKIEGVTVPRPARTQTMQAVSSHETNIPTLALSG
jgi:hypothetical protein